MDDSKLLDLTSIRLSKTSQSEREQNINIFENKRRGSTKLKNGFLPHCSIENDSDPLLQSKTLPSLPKVKHIPKHIFEKKKAATPKNNNLKRNIAWESNGFELSSHEEELIHSGNKPNSSISKRTVEKRIPALISSNLVSNSNILHNSNITSTNSSYHSLKNESKLPLDLQQRQKKLSNQQKAIYRDANLSRLQLLVNMDSMLTNMPLKYMYTKPELRKYAIERAAKLLIKPAIISIQKIYSHAFKKFIEFRKSKPAFVLLHEKEVGLLLLMKRFSIHFEHMTKIAFYHWSYLYSSRFDKKKAAEMLAAVVAIQRWYRNIRATANDKYQKLASIMQTCIQRRKAIRYLINFEGKRLRAIEKIRTGIANRRKYYYLARCIQRYYKWVLKFRKTRRKLLRRRIARQIQRWIRRMHKRTKRDLLIIRLISRIGGPKRVFPAIPSCFQKRSKLSAIEGCVYKLQIWMLKHTGKLDEHLNFVNRAHRNDCASIIQNSYLAYRWRMLCLQTKLNNKARRLQRALRCHLYRIWIRRRVEYSNANKIQNILRRALGMKKLYFRFAYRKIRTKALLRIRLESIKKIQSAFRTYISYEQAKREAIRKYQEEQRRIYLRNHKASATISKNWRRQRDKVALAKRIQDRQLRLSELKKIQIRVAVKNIQRRWRNYIKTKRFLHLQRIREATRKLVRAFRHCKADIILQQKIAHRKLAGIKLEQKREKFSNIIQKNCRVYFWMKTFNRRAYENFAVKKRMALELRSVLMIQRFYRRVMMQYFMPMRIVARVQLSKKRHLAELQLQVEAALKIQKFYRRHISGWKKIMSLIERERQNMIKQRHVYRAYKFIRFVAVKHRLQVAFRRQKAAREAEAERLKQFLASQRIAKQWKRIKMKQSLSLRFRIRKKMLADLSEANEAKRLAEAERLRALEAARATEEALAASIASAWKQGSDSDGRNYFYNYITGESRWDPPPGWVPPDGDLCWVRNTDERGNVYYYNVETGESRWLPPCTACGCESVRWCENCRKGYCKRDYEELHNGEDAEPEMAEHIWSGVETTRGKLQKGEIYCVECKKSAAELMCTTCWDGYCDKCFQYIHHVGALKKHQSIPYKTAKQGWYCIKARDEDEQDYFVHGLTGETTFEKPEELMSESEREYFRNFKVHRTAAEEHVHKIEDLQYELERLKYERDLEYSNKLMQEGAALIDRVGTPNKKVTPEDVISNVGKKMKPTSFFKTDIAGAEEYRKKLLTPDERRRGKKRSDYIQSLLEGVEGDT